MKQSDDKNIDRLFKDHFDKKDVPMEGAEELWAEIEPKTRKKSRRFFWIFPLLGLIGGLFYLTLTWSDDEFLVGEQKAVTEQQLKSTEGDLATNTETKKSDSKELDNENQNAVTKEKSEIANIDKSDLTIVVDDASSNNNVSTDGKTIIDQFAKSFSNNVNVESSDFVKSRISDDLSTATNERSDLAESDRQNIFREDSSEGQNLGIREIHNKDISFLPILKKDEFANSEFDLDANLFEEEVNEILSREPISISKFALGLNAGYFHTIEQLSDDQLSFESAKYLATFQGNFDILSSFFAEASLAYQVRNRLAVSIGFEYQHIEVQFENSGVISERILIDFDKAFIEDGATPVFYSGEVYAQQNYSHTTLAKVTEVYYNVPLTLSYDLVKKDKITLALKTGLVVNLRKNYDGYFLQENFKYKTINSNNQSRFMKSRIGAAYEFGVEARYELTPKLFVTLNPNFRFNPSNHLEADKLIGLRRSFVGINLGLNRSF